MTTGARPSTPPLEHELKVWPEFFDDLESGAKPFEARKDDGRNYATGQILWLREWQPETCAYTGRELRRRVSYVLRGPAFGIEAEYCVLGLAVLPPAEPPRAQEVWQPMETARHDGRAIIGRTWDGTVHPVFWSPVDGWRWCGDGWRGGAAPRLTGWQSIEAALPASVPAPQGRTITPVPAYQPPAAPAAGEPPQPLDRLRKRLATYRADFEPAAENEPQGLSVIVLSACNAFETMIDDVAATLPAAPAPATGRQEQE